MKQKVFTLLTLLVLCVTGAWAVSTTGHYVYTRSAKGTTGTDATLGVTWTAAKGSGSSEPSNQKDYLRLKPNNTLTISTTNKVPVTEVKLTFTTANSKALPSSTSNVENTSSIGSVTFNGAIMAWSGSTTSSLVFTSKGEYDIIGVTICCGEKSVTIAAAGYSTFCSGSALDLSDLTGVTAYKVEDANVTSTSVTLASWSSYLGSAYPLSQGFGKDK